MAGSDQFNARSSPSGAGVSSVETEIGGARGGLGENKRFRTKPMSSPVLCFGLELNHIVSATEGRL